MNPGELWSDVFSNSTPGGLDEQFARLGKEFHNFYRALEGQKEIRFQYTADQQRAFNDQFRELAQLYTKLFGEDYLASVRRLGLIHFRLGMVLSVLRLMETGQIPKALVCQERDFKTASLLIDTLIRHTALVYSELPSEPKLKPRQQKQEKFYKSLPQEFTHADYKRISEALNVKAKTAERWVAKWVEEGKLLYPERNLYKKPLGEMRK